MSVDNAKHKAVVVLNKGDLAFGFPHIYSAVAFVERQVNTSNLSKVVKSIAEAMEDGLQIDTNHYQILDVESFLDLYTEDDEVEDDE